MKEHRAGAQQHCTILTCETGRFIRLRTKLYIDVDVDVSELPLIPNEFDDDSYAFKMNCALGEVGVVARLR